MVCVSGVRSWRNQCLWVVVLLWCVGCGQVQSPHLRFGLSSAPLNLDPRYAVDATSVRINRLLYQRLVDFDERMQPQPALAEWRLISPTHYRFTLRADRAKFSDGSTLSAEDVKLTYDYVLDAQHGSPHRGSLALIKKIVVVDEHTLDFVIERADPLFPAYLALGILPKQALRAQHSFKDQPIGNGPFGFAAWPEENRLFLTRRADGLKVEFVRVPEPTVRVLKLMRGEIDVLQNDVPPELIGLLKEHQDVQVIHKPGTNFTYIGFNMEDPVTQRIQVRQAVAHAVDIDAILQYVWGEGARSAQALFPASHWAGNPALQAIPHDPERARDLLKAAGFDANHPLALVYKTSSDPFRLRLATILQAQLARVGIEVDVRSYDWGTFFGDIKAGRFQMYTLSWVGIKTPDIFRYIFHSQSMPPEGANRGRYRSEKVDQLIEAAQALDTLAAQAEQYRQLQAQLVQDLPYVPLWYENHFAATRSRVQGYQLAADGNYDGLMQVKFNASVH